MLRHQLELPLATLSVGSCGVGDPVIAVPATISLIEDWEPLIRFVGQRYTVHFFELPGYGGSTPLANGYSSEHIAELVEQMADHLGVERFGLLGFSFGGLLALRTLQRCADRVDRVCLLAPYVGREAMKHSRREFLGIRAALIALRSEAARRGMIAALRSPAGLAFTSWFMRATGRFETSSDLRARLATLTVASLEVLLAQIDELLTTSAEDLAGPYTTPCLFGMSVFDTTLDFDRTREFMGRTFPYRTEEQWEFPYHAPPTPLTMDDYERDYRTLVEWNPNQALSAGIRFTGGLDTVMPTVNPHVDAPLSA